LHRIATNTITMIAYRHKLPSLYSGATLRHNLAADATLPKQDKLKTLKNVFFHLMEQGTLSSNNKCQAEQEDICQNS
jgi:hypothetical protein